MTELFGLDMATLAAALTTALIAALAIVGTLALRNRVFLRMALRNVRRRRGRSALIVLGLMLGTTIITAALVTGDTMSHTVRTSSVASLGQTDELVSARGAEVEFLRASPDAAGARYFPEAHARRVVAAADRSPLVDGAAAAIVESVAVQDLTSRQGEPRVTLFAADAARLDGFGEIRATDGEPRSLASLAPGELYLTQEAAEELGARRGDVVRVLAGDATTPGRVQDVVDYDGTGADGPALLLPLADAQRLLGEEGMVKHVLVSNRGDEIDGARHSARVSRALAPALAPLGLEAQTVKQDALEVADLAGRAFMSIFTTFGSFSIAAGLLLIFLIFVMLAAERRAELGIARAIGTRRGHLVQTFLFEGAAYALLAAAAGAAAGVGVAYLMVRIMAAAVSATSEVVDVSYAVTPASVAVAYGFGVLLTLAVVAFSAWRVSRMNIVAAIGDQPEGPARPRGRARRLSSLVGLVAGGAVLAAGVRTEDAVALGLGAALVILSLVPLARAAGLADRPVRTAAGLALVAWFTLPTEDWLLGDPRMDFSLFILGGLMIVIGVTWAIVYNADLLLGALSATLGRVRALAPVLKMAAAYPLRSRFRTGVTLAMFTLVVFTLVVGGTTSKAFTNAFNDLDAFGGGFDVRATTAPASPVGDLRAALRRARGVAPADITAVASQSLLPVEARQVGAREPAESYAVRGLDRTFVARTTYGLATRARGYSSDAEVWRAVGERSGLAVVDATVVRRRANFNLGVAQELQLAGFYLEDQGFEPVTVDVRDPQEGGRLRLTVIGVLSETAPVEMAGFATSQRTLEATFGERAAPTIHLLSLREGVDATATARALERAFLPSGMEADALDDLLAETVSASMTFNRLVQGFMGLGLIVGVAALGVITARSVVERRQHIGVLRAIGFRRRMVWASFVLESSFIALTSILVGTAFGLVVARNLIADSQEQPSWANLGFDVPWTDLAMIFLAVYAVTLLTTFAPARRASRVYPAEALRYQ